MNVPTEVAVATVGFYTAWVVAVGAVFVLARRESHVSLRPSLADVGVSYAAPARGRWTDWNRRLWEQWRPAIVLTALYVIRAIREHRHWLPAVLLMVALGVVANFAAKVVGSLGLSARAIFGEHDYTRQAATSFDVNAFQAFFVLLGGAGVAEEVTLVDQVIRRLACASASIGRPIRHPRTHRALHLGIQRRWSPSDGLKGRSPAVRLSHCSTMPAVIVLARSQPTRRSDPATSGQRSGVKFVKLTFSRTALGLVPLVGLLLAPADLANSSVARSATGAERSSTIATLPDSDRESSLPVPEDPYEMLPRLRYRLAPAAPVAVVGTAGTPGSGLITLTWQQDWPGRGQLQGFLTTEQPTGESISVAGSLRTTTFTGLAAGAYTFQVTARGQYDDTQSSASSLVILLPAPTPARPGCGHLIDVNLSTQSLVASSCSTVYLTSPITSGMPGLRTPTGRFPIFLKERNLNFYSPWPPSSQYYYPPMSVAYAAEFAGGGYYLHTDPNEPLNAYGPGSQNGPYASHGCIHVPYEVMASLYTWAPYGTRVYIHY